MCIQSSLQWGKQNLTRKDIQGKRVIEVGSYDVNGSFRSIVAPFNPIEYVGTDMRSGPGVDIECPAENLVSRFGSESFDIVISTSTLEHIRDWKQAVSNIKNICKSEGIVIITAPSNFPFHAFPNDFWRYTPADFEDIFSDFNILVLEEDPTLPSLVYLKAQKLKRFVENDLSDYRLYSIVAGKRVKEIHTRDFFTLRFVHLFTRYIYRLHVRPRVLKPYLYVTMGIKLKIIKPIMRLLSGQQ
jgi:SAM-dependent methyltransferase